MTRRRTCELAFVVVLATAWLLPDSGARAAESAAPSQALVELGRRLFFDPAASSRTGMRSCADCHDPNHGWSDPELRSRDVRDVSNRHSQTLIDVGDAKRVHWDGQFESIEDLIRTRLAPENFPPEPGEARTVAYYGPAARLDALETPPRAAPFVGLGSPPPETPPDLIDPAVRDDDIESVTTRIQGSHRYDAWMRAAFGSADATLDRLVTALSAFCRSIRSGESDYDRFQAGDRSALSPAQRRGLELFRGKAGCASCHRMNGSRATFCDQDFHDTGVVWAAVERKLHLDGVFEPDALDGRVDDGAMPFTEHARDRRAFKTPTLRDVALHPPYMHDARCATLEAAVVHYLQRTHKDPAIDPKMPTYAATDQDIDDLVQFLHALTSRTTPGRAPESVPTRVGRARLRVLDANLRPIAGLRLVLRSAGEAIGDGAPRPEVVAITDARGDVVYDMPASTHVRVDFGGGLLPMGGDLVPDGSSDARIVLPVSGFGRLRVTFPKGADAPEGVFLVHTGARFCPGRNVPMTRFDRESVVEGKDGTNLGLYRGLVRLDVAPSSRPWVDALDRLDWPGEVLFDRARVAEVDLTK